ARRGGWGRTGRGGPGGPAGCSSTGPAPAAPGWIPAAAVTRSPGRARRRDPTRFGAGPHSALHWTAVRRGESRTTLIGPGRENHEDVRGRPVDHQAPADRGAQPVRQLRRSEEHTSELQ